MNIDRVIAEVTALQKYDEITEIEERLEDCTDTIAEEIKELLLCIKYDPSIPAPIKEAAERVEDLQERIYKLEEELKQCRNYS